MGEHVEFPSNGGTAGGYIAPAKDGAGPGILVIQEWWGLVDQLRRVCDRLSDEGFTALAPDLYHGELAKHTELGPQVSSIQSPEFAARLAVAQRK